MKHKFEKLLAAFLMILLLTGMVFPQIQPSFANNIFNPSITYNSGTGKWDIKWIPIDGTETYSVTMHGPWATCMNIPINSVFDGVLQHSKPCFCRHFIYLVSSWKENLCSLQINTGTGGHETLFSCRFTFQGTSFNDAAVLGDYRTPIRILPQRRPDDKL